MVPIKSNRFANQYSPLDMAEIKSQPFKLIKKTAMMAVHGGFLSRWFSRLFLPMISMFIPTPCPLS
ncbi:hypothetical protein Hanom_Chr00s121603g01811861 [Helianthus anomalus]